MIHYRLDIGPDFDLRFLSTLNMEAGGTQPGKNVDGVTQFKWGWRARFKHHLHPDVLHIAVNEEVKRALRGEPAYWRGTDNV